jgi:hypothetical protein
VILLAQVNKKVTIIIVILILIGAGAYLLMKKVPQLPNNQTTVTQNKPATTGQTMQGTLKSLLSSGKSQKCEYVNKTEATSVSGTVYISNGKMKGDFTTVSGENKITGHMIVNSGYSYVWTDMMTKRGIKMAINQQQQQPSGVPANNQALDMNKTFTYTCQGWTEDNTVFTPPSDISFSTFALPPVRPSGVVPSNAGANPSACSACDNLPAGAAKDACKTQLHCQ